MASPIIPPAQADSVLISGQEYLAANPAFKLIGRKDDLNAIMDVLLRKSAENNLILCGNNGVGLSTLLLGLESIKTEPSTPLDLVGKSFFYLDTDKLFAAGGADAVTAKFQEALDTLEKSENAVLVVSDTKAFLDGVQNSGAHEIVNKLMHVVRTDSTIQAIFETSNDELPKLHDAHTDLQKSFTVMEIHEPNKDDLRPIVENLAKEISEAYGVDVSKEAVDSVLDLTTKYPGLTLGMAQPKRSATILEGAMTAYIRTAHAKPPGIDALEETLAALDTGKLPPDLADRTPDELATVRLETETEMQQITAQWESTRKEVQELAAAQVVGEQSLRELDAEIEKQKAKDADTRTFREAFKAAATDDEQAKVKEDYKAKYGEELTVGKKEEVVTLNKFAAIGGSEEMSRLEGERKRFAAELAQQKTRYTELTAGMYTDLSLTDTHVLGEFSRLAGVDVKKLQQDDTEKLMQLEDTIRKRVFGQDEAVSAVAKAVRRGKAGLKKPNKPIGTFLFLGPTGVGKTELAKAVTEALFGDERAMNVFNMPEYSEKNAVTKMIGSPPGYEGYQEGGLLTNAMMRRPSCVNLFDEVEKAHTDMFDILLRVADEGRLSDNHGREVFFGDAINILTSNIGSAYFLDEELTYDEAKEKALKDLLRHPDPNDMSKEIGFRPEFLKRLDGIFCFNRLGDGQIKLVALKSLKELNGWLEEKGITVDMPEQDVEAMCKEKYKPEDGARGVMNYIASTITSDVSDTVLLNPKQPGTVKVTYSDGEVKTEFQKKAPDAAPATAPAAPKPPAP